MYLARHFFSGHEGCAKQVNGRFPLEGTRAVVDFKYALYTCMLYARTSKPGSAIGTLSIPLSSNSAGTSPSIDTALNSIDNSKISESSPMDGGGGGDRSISLNPLGSFPPAFCIAFSRTFCHCSYRSTACCCSLRPVSSVCRSGVPVRTLTQSCVVCTAAGLHQTVLG